jgi:geranylgeranyl pyrophosphate synthase
MSPVDLLEKGLGRLSQLDSLYESEMPHSNSSLSEAARYHFQYPGKSFRAQLALSSGDAVNQDQQDSLNWAAACELLHNASLIHDDISDASTHRRGQASINNKFGPDMALCLGDWMVAKAFELASRNHKYGGKLTAILAKAMQDTCSGQSSDVKQFRCANLSQWQIIAKGKTAPLLAAPIKGAAISVELQANLDPIDELVAFCGLAYQGRNDINDIVPSSHRSCDLDGRKPNLVVSLYAYTDSAQKQGFHRWYTSEDKDSVTKWQKNIASSDAIVKANELVSQWLEQADALVSLLPQQLQSVASGLISSVKLTAVLEQQEQTA